MVLFRAAPLVQQDRCAPLSYPPGISASGSRHRQSQPRGCEPPPVRGVRLRSAALIWPPAYGASRSQEDRVRLWNCLTPKQSQRLWRAPELHGTSECIGCSSASRTTPAALRDLKKKAGITPAQPPNDLSLIHPHDLSYWRAGGCRNPGRRAVIRHVDRTIRASGEKVRRMQLVASHNRSRTWGAVGVQRDLD